MSYNFTQGYNITGIGCSESGQDVCYNFSIDLELITVVLIIIMLCQIVQTGYLFLTHIGLIKRWP